MDFRRNKKSAEREFKKFKELPKDEPSDLTSGDMDKIIHGEVSPKEPFIKARQFAVQERLKLKK